LPKEKLIAEELEKTRRMIELRKRANNKKMCEQAVNKQIKINHSGNV
jgi:hypothetical protein